MQGGGWLTLWEEGSDPTQPGTTTPLTAGSKLEIQPGQVHYVIAGDQGMTFHELVASETFGKRSTWFL